MDEFETKSKVYVQTDNQGRILRCEGGYTMSNIDDISEWIFFFVGVGDKYNLCQSQYFEGGLYTEDGICRYVYSNGNCRLRTDVEIDADRKAQSIRRADKDYDPGEYITIDGTLYRVILPIFAGAKITVGTNVEATTLGAEITRLKEEETI